MRTSRNRILPLGRYLIQLYCWLVEGGKHQCLNFCKATKVSLRHGAQHAYQEFCQGPSPRTAALLDIMVASLASTHLVAPHHTRHNCAHAPLKHYRALESRSNFHHLTTVFPPKTVNSARLEAFPFQSSTAGSVTGKATWQCFPQSPLAVSLAEHTQRAPKPNPDHPHVTAPNKEHGSTLRMLAAENGWLLPPLETNICCPLALREATGFTSGAAGSR